MKKLISLLGVISITASSISVVTACGNNEQNSFNNSQDQNNVSKLMTQYAKALYLNQNEINTDTNDSQGLGSLHYSSSYIMNDFVKDNYISNLGLDSFEGVETSDYTRYSDISEKYFKNSVELVDEQTNVDSSIYQEGVVAPEISGTMGTITSLVQSLPLILNNLSSPEKFISLMGILSKKLEELISPNLLKTLGKVLNNDVLKDFENAFSINSLKDDKNEFFNYEDTLNAGIIALSNSLDKLINKDSSDETLTYNNSDNINLNIKSASKKVANNLNQLIKGEKKLSFDILTDVSVVPGILYFLRNLLVYINTIKIDMDKVDEIKLFTISEIDEIRTKKLDENSNQLDIKNIVNILYVITNDEKEKGSTVLKNIIGILLATPGDEKPDDSTGTLISSPYNGKKNGLINIISEFAIKLLGSEYLEGKILSMEYIIYIDQFVRSFINWGIGYKSSEGTLTNNFSLVLSFLNEKDILNNFDGFIKDFIINIGKNDWDEYFKNPGKWIDYLYDNNNEKLNLSIKKMLSEPIENLLNSSLFSSNDEVVKIFDNKKDLGLGFLMSESVKKIINTIYKTITLKENENLNYVIKFDSFANLFNSLYKNDALQNALSDIDNFMNNLGLNKDNTIAKDSPLDRIQTILNENLGWLSGIISIINNMISEYNKRLSNTKKVANSIFLNLDVSIKSNSLNDFEYVVKNKLTNIENTFKIKLRYAGNYLKVDELYKLDK
ncbi:Vmc-like lipoprotein signal peptide domain-containing protein [Spiroplasma turonicum]|uniref:MOLPALP family lipoprotein n=1 Tax=Spiroplasma turonicum TaxID=216946 RepID=A0A0K1P680_9MOLU|nr:hypothetical protein [Spiroplasma turonicum]AKU79775.1 hypothetical protein STURON_00529 [Spiroplasma turonicum]ALX70793.1 hypothetical protein STURO_v1c05270 [Spiroplasma turonicum]